MSKINLPPIQGTQLVEKSNQPIKGWKQKLVNFWQWLRQQKLGLAIIIIFIIGGLGQFFWQKVYINRYDKGFKVGFNEASNNILNNTILLAKKGQFVNLSSSNLISNLKEKKELTDDLKSILGVTDEDLKATSSPEVKTVLVDVNKFINCLNDKNCGEKFIKQEPSQSTPQPAPIETPTEQKTNQPIK